MYFDPATTAMKGEIPWGPTLRVELKNSRKFDVHTVSAFYCFGDTSVCLMLMVCFLCVVAKKGISSQRNFRNSTSLERRD